MPIGNSNAQAYRDNWASAVVQTTAASPVTYGPFYPGPYTRARIGIQRTASVGGQTMDAKLQYYNATGTAADLLDHAGNAVSFVQWADDSHIEKVIEVGPTTLSSDADDTITSTNYKWYNVSLPESFVIIVTGATGTSDTFSGYIDWLP
jgi:hypothetical protein